MNAQVVVVVVAALFLLVPIWWPTNSSSPSDLLINSVILAPPRQLSISNFVAALLLCSSGLIGVLLYGPITAFAILVLTAICVGAIKVQLRARRSLQEADQLAQFTNSLANQAMVAPTVVQAIQRSAPLVEGRIGIAAKQMAAECETGGLVEASTRFANTVNRPIAEMLSTVLIEAFRGGSQWISLANVLAEEASAFADTARHFYRHVAALMPQIAVTVVLAAAMLGITGFAAKDVGAWLVSTSGQQLMLVLALFAAALCGRILLPAWTASK